ncbi:t-SNARE coiled-coil homology domain-containing protein [Plasmodiophora brassicae]|uniref:t-SNARE coiled-coil homology domain-containing protein n=2 Tax=Plasmodiophora brassicae TaxID=37360 RepID=A0A3P3Y902_PLABS|nr:unnamed protein product [Plasmodiophora brassicae]
MTPEGSTRPSASRPRPLISAAGNRMVRQTGEYRDEETIRRDALATALATEELGANTLVQLRRQTEQMENMSGELAEVDADLTRTQRTIRSMRSFSGRVKNWFSKSEPLSEIEERRASRQASASNGSRETRSQYELNKLTRTRQERRDSTDPSAQVDALHAVVRNLSAMASDMHSELSIQNDLLNDIDKDMTSVQTSLANQTRQLKKML